MSRIDRDEEREERIAMEAIVDAYSPEEQALGWYYYLEDRIAFPFQGRCITERSLSPLRKGEIVEVIGMASEDGCMCEMFVKVQWMDRTLGVPLAQLEVMGVDEESQEALADWHYWVDRGYQLC